MLNDLFLLDQNKTRLCIYWGIIFTYHYSSIKGEIWVFSDNSFDAYFQLFHWIHWIKHVLGWNMLKGHHLYRLSLYTGMFLLNKLKISPNKSIFCRKEELLRMATLHNRISFSNMYSFIWKFSPLAEMSKFWTIFIRF